MLKGRNLTSHIYSEKTAIEISRKIIDDYIPLFKRLLEKIGAMV